MKYAIVAVSALVVAVQASPADYGSGSSSAAPASFTPTPGGPCGPSGGNYCAGTSGQTNIILRCTGSALQPGNCNDNLSEPEFGAVCIDSAPSGGAAQCQANSAPAQAASTSAAGGGGAVYPTGSAPAQSTGGSAPASTYPASSAAAGTGTAPIYSTGSAAAPPPIATGSSGAAPVPAQSTYPASSGNATAAPTSVPTQVPSNAVSSRGVSLAAVIGAVALLFFA